MRDWVVVPLTQGRYAYISPEDYTLIKPYTWRLLKTKHGEYAQSGNGILMHRLIMKPSADLEIDHINRDGLDNRRENLRLCTSSQNKHNTKVRKDSSTGYRGIYYNTKYNKYYVQIKPPNAKRIFVGAFSNLSEAIKRYEEVAITIFEDFYNANI